MSSSPLPNEAMARRISAGGMRSSRSLRSVWIASRSEKWKLSEGVISPCFSHERSCRSVMPAIRRTSSRRYAPASSAPLLLAITPLYFAASVAIRCVYCRPGIRFRLPGAAWRGVISSMPASKESWNPTRREVLAATAFVPLAALVASAQTPAGALTPAQKSTLEAFLDRLCPRDESGPGAVDCGAANYIDHVLAGPNAGEKSAFAEGLAALDAAAGGSFATLSGEQRDAIITSFEDGM